MSATANDRCADLVAQGSVFGPEVERLILDAYTLGFNDCADRTNALMQRIVDGTDDTYNAIVANSSTSDSSPAISSLDMSWLRNSFVYLIVLVAFLALIAQLLS